MQLSLDEKLSSEPRLKSDGLIAKKTRKATVFFLYLISLCLLLATAGREYCFWLLLNLEVIVSEDTQAAGTCVA